MRGKGNIFFLKCKVRALNKNRYLCIGIIDKS